MESMSIGHYRSHDPPKNFAIKVKFSKVKQELGIPSARFSAVTSRNPELAQEALELADKKQNEENEELVVHWQEKLFSEAEFEYYSDLMNCPTSIEKKYHEDIQAIKRTHGDRPNKRIFTYVDQDNFCVQEDIRSVTFSENEPLAPLAEKMAAGKYKNMARKPLNSHLGLRRRGIVVDKPTDVMQGNHIITTPSKRMQIMVDVSRKTVDGNGLTNMEQYDERVLCNVKIDANGLIVTKPDIFEKKLLKLEVYHNIRTVYQYSLEDASVRITKLQKGQEASLHNELYNRHSQLMQIHVGNELYPLPQSNEVFMYSLCEIVSAKNFEYNSLYVQYYLELPSGWISANNNLFGVTQSCAMNDEHVAHFCFPIEFQIKYQWPEDDPDEFLNWPTLYLQVYSLDSWQRHRIEGYGYCQLPDVASTTKVQVDTWRPKDDGTFSDMRRCFIGGTRELKDLTYVKNPGDNEDSKLSKFYFKSVSAGSVVLRINTMIQTKVVAEEGSATLKWKKAIQKAGAYATAVDSLSQIMDAFHRARKRMLAARATLPVM